MSFESVAQKIAGKASLKELANARALGYDPVDAYIRCWRVLDEVYAAAFEIERPAVWQTARVVIGRAST